MTRTLLLYGLLVVIASCKNNQEEVVQQDVISIDTSLSVTEGEPSIYSGQSLDSVYNCQLLVNPDSSVIFIYEWNTLWVYGEHHGAISWLHDSTYSMGLEQNYAQYIRKYWYKDSFQIWRNKEDFPELDSAEIWFESGQKLNPSYAESGIISCPIPIDSNERVQNININPHHLNPITQEPIIIGVPSRSIAEFGRGRKVEIEIIISGNTIKSTNQKPTQTGHFVLKKQ